MNNTLKKVKSLFHTHTFTGYAGGVPYLYNNKNDGVIDGINVMHVNLYSRCDTVEKRYL